MHRFIRLAAIRIHLGYPERVFARLLFEHAGERSIGVRFSPERVINNCQALLLSCVVCFLLHLDECGVAVTARKQYEAKVIVRPGIDRANVQRPSRRSLGFGQMAATLLNPPMNDETARVQGVLSLCRLNLPQRLVPTTECERE